VEQVLQQVPGGPVRQRALPDEVQEVLQAPGLQRGQRPERVQQKAEGVREVQGQQRAQQAPQVREVRPV
jgi:hypothetical protein